MARPITKLKNIESAAIRLFAERGLQNVTIKDIAREAECTEGALYRHYSSKEEMGWGLYVREIRTFAANLRNVLGSEAPFSDRVHAAVTTFYRFFDEEPDLFGFILLSRHYFSESSNMEPKDNPRKLVEKFIQQGQKAGAFSKSDVALRVCMIMGLVLDPLTMKKTGMFKGKMERRAETVAEVCLKVLGVKE